MSIIVRYRRHGNLAATAGPAREVPGKTCTTIVAHVAAANGEELQQRRRMWSATPPQVASGKPSLDQAVRALTPHRTEFSARDLGRHVMSTIRQSRFFVQSGSQLGSLGQSERVASHGLPPVSQRRGQQLAGRVSSDFSGEQAPTVAKSALRRRPRSCAILGAKPAHLGCIGQAHTRTGPPFDPAGPRMVGWAEKPVASDEGVFARGTSIDQCSDILKCLRPRFMCGVNYCCGK